ncbi:MAG: hypothetical protein Q9192_008681 [Flavoplaca navasiana]
MVSCQTTLFSLPHEIRDAIYDFVLNSSGNPPSCPQHAGVRYEEVIDIGLYGPELAGVIYPLLNTYYGPGSALSQVNRRLRQELHDFITNPHLTRIITYKLDAMLQGTRLWLSWTSVPPSMSKIDNLEIDLRILDTQDDAFFSRDSPRFHTIFLVLLRAINRLLNHGPSFRYQDDTHGLKVYTLTINLLHRYDKLFRPNEQSMKERESPRPEDVVTSEAVHLNVIGYLLGRLDTLVHLGLFSGKLQSLRVSRWGGPIVYFTRNFEPSVWLPDELTRCGAKWGSDKEMRVEKVNSADLCASKDEELK